MRTQQTIGRAKAQHSCRVAYNFTASGGTAQQCHAVTAEVASAAYIHLVNHGHALHFTLQNIAEFCSVSTRPAEKNGFGLTIVEAKLQVRDIELAMNLLPDTAEVYAVRRRLLYEARVQGKEVHDARLAACLQVHGIRHLVTWDAGDFKRYTFLTCASPDQILAGALS